MGELARRSTTPAKAAKKTPAKKAPAKKAAAKKVPAKKAPAKKGGAKKAVAKKAPAKKVPPRKKVAAKKVSPRTSGPQRPHRKANSQTTTGPGPTPTMPQLPAPPVDPLMVLGLSEPLRLGELRSAWRVFAARHHPDRGGDAVTFARGQQAYDVLKQRLAPTVSEPRRR